MFYMFTSFLCFCPHSQGRNFCNFSFVFWEKWWLHIFILKLTDLYVCNCRFSNVCYHLCIEKLPQIVYICVLLKKKRVYTTCLVFCTFGSYVAVDLNHKVKCTTTSLINGTSNKRICPLIIFQVTDSILLASTAGRVDFSSYPFIKAYPKEVQIIYRLFLVNCYLLHGIIKN